MKKYIEIKKLLCELDPLNTGCSTNKIASSYHIEARIFHLLSYQDITPRQVLLVFALVDVSGVISDLIASEVCESINKLEDK